MACDSNKIIRLHERCLRLIHNDKKTSFEELLEIDSCLFMIEILRALATEIYHAISPTIMKEIFTLRHQNQYSFTHWTWTSFDFPNLELLIMVLGVLDISVLRFGKLYQYIKKSKIPLTNLKLLLKDGKQNLVHVVYAKPIYKT